MRQKPPIMINQGKNSTAAKCVLLLLLVLCISSSSHAHPSLRNGSKVDVRTIAENYQHPMIRRQPFPISTEQEDEDRKISGATSTPVNNLRGGTLKISSITTNNSSSEAHSHLRGGAPDAFYDPRLSSYGSAPYVRRGSSANTKKSSHLRGRSCAFCRDGQHCPYAVATKAASGSTQSPHTDL